jgi:hypothetical protein
MAAEDEAQLSNLDKAESCVNIILNGAADPTGFVHTYKDDSKPTGGYH